MAISLSFKATIIIALSVVMIVSGSVFVWKVAEMRNIVKEIPVPGQAGVLKAEVIPSMSQQGTLFFIKAQYFENREQQEIPLKIEKQGYKDSIYVFDDGEHFDGEGGDGVYGGYFDSEGKDIGKYEVKAGDLLLADFVVHEEGCEIIQGDYDETKINFVVLPSGYEDYERFKNDFKNLINGWDSLLEIEPFKSNKERFSFFAVNTTRDFECEIGCKGISTLVCCNSKTVLEEASRCDYDSVIVLVNSREECGSASYYTKICSKNSYANTVLVHELGHSFADLADEYVYADYFGDYSVGEVREINCDEEGCEKWKNISEGCYEGCTYSHLYRPAEKYSIMFDLYPKFNDVCKSHIEELIKNYYNDKSARKAEEKSYFINLNYNQGAIVFENAFVKPIKSWQDFRESDYSIELITEEGKVFNSSLYIPDKIFPIPPYGRIVYEDDVDFSFTLPFYEDAEEIRIYRNDRLVAFTDIALLSDNCGNGICENFENHLSCPVDCKITDNFCETNSCDSDCPSQANCKDSERIILIASASLLIAASLLIISLIMWKIKRK